MRILRKIWAIWRKLMWNGCSYFKGKWVEYSALKHSLQKQDTNMHYLQTSIKNWSIKCLDAFFSEEQVFFKPRKVTWKEALPLYIYPICGLVCNSAGGLIRHCTIHKDIFQLVNTKMNNSSVTSTNNPARLWLKSQLCAHCHVVTKMVFFWQVDKSLYTMTSYSL